MAEQRPLIVTVFYHEEEDGGWSVDSPDAPGYMAYAPTLDEARRLANEGLAFYLGVPVAIYDPTEALGGAQPAWENSGAAEAPTPGEWEVDDESAARYRGAPSSVGIPSELREAVA
jgi:predicted RNase H-like HicB family nuclease